MHACDTQTASGTGEFGVFEGTASANGDIGMQGEPSVKLASSKLQKSDCFFQVVGSLFSGRVALSEMASQREVATAIGELGRKKYPFLMTI